MLIDRGPGLSGRTCTPKLVIFTTNQKFLTENLREDYFLLLKYPTSQCVLFPLPGPKHTQNLTLKCKILNVVWT